MAHPSGLGTSGRPGPTGVTPVARPVTADSGGRHRRPTPASAGGLPVCFNSLAMTPPSPRISVASPTGQQWRIGHGEQEVVVCEVGATLRSYIVGTTPIIDGFGPTSGRTADGARCSRPGRTGWPTGASSSTACGRRRPWTSRSVATPFTAWCGGCPGPCRPVTRTSSRCACSCTHTGLPVLVAARDGVPRRPRRPQHHHARPQHARRPGALRPRVPPVPGAGPDIIDGAILSCRRTQTLELDDRGLPTGVHTPVAGTDRDFTTSRFIGPTVLDTPSPPSTVTATAGPGPASMPPTAPRAPRSGPIRASVT